VPNGNVPFFRFLDPTSTRVVSVYRQNATGAVGLGYQGSNFSAGAKLALSTWATVALHVVTNGTSSTVQLSLNGTLIYQTGSASLGTAGVATIQIGNDTAAQAFTLVADTISAQAGSMVFPPANTALPTVSGTAQVGQTLRVSSGGWAGSQPLSYAYQWQRCDSGGAGCGPIAGATGSSYLVASGDAGNTLRVAATASNSAGSATATSAATAVVQQAGAPPPGQVALWHIDETSGTVMYDSVGGHNGTLSNVQTGLPGFSGFAYGFNGSSSYVSVPSADNLNPGSADITITIHIKTTGTPPPSPADWDLIRKGLYTTTGGEYKMEFQQSGQA
jgi:hypothetical protein